MLKTMSLSLFAGVLAVAAFAGTAKAACAADRCEDVGVTELYLHNGHQRLLVATSGAETSVSNCNAVQDRYLIVPRAHALFEQIYSMLLAAQLSGNR